MKIFLLLFGLFVSFTANAEDKHPALVGDIDKNSMVSCVSLDLQMVQECVDYVVDTRWLCNQGYEFHGDLMAISFQPSSLRVRYIQSFILSQKVKERSGKEQCTREK